MSNKTFSIRMDDELHDILVAFAEDTDRSKSAVIRVALRQYLGLDDKFNQRQKVASWFIDNLSVRKVDA